MHICYSQGNRLKKPKEAVMKQANWIRSLTSHILPITCLYAIIANRRPSVQECERNENTAYDRR